MKWSLSSQLKFSLEAGVEEAGVSRSSKATGEVVVVATTEDLIKSDKEEMVATVHMGSKANAKHSTVTSMMKPVTSQEYNS